jgi:hypothetical protein
VTAAFEALQVPPDYRYYFLNQENNPFGVAGLKSGYVLEDPDWRSVDPASPVFKKVVELVRSFPARGSFSEGSIILDPRKNPIGIWYSSLGAGISIDPNTKRVMITTACSLSQQRAEAVMAGLVQLGVDAGRLKAEGCGQEHPIADNSTAEGRAKNRRIDIRVTGK